MDVKKQKALAALLSSPTKEAAAKKAGINTKTLRRYLQDEEFSSAYKKRLVRWSRTRRASSSKA